MIIDDLGPKARIAIPPNGTGDVSLAVHVPKNMALAVIAIAELYDVRPSDVVQWSLRGAMQALDDQYETVGVERPPGRAAHPQ